VLHCDTLRKYIKRVFTVFVAGGLDEGNRKTGCKYTDRLKKGRVKESRKISFNLDIMRKTGDGIGTGGIIWWSFSARDNMVTVTPKEPNVTIDAAEKSRHNSLRGRLGRRRTANGSTLNWGKNKSSTNQRKGHHETCTPWSYLHGRITSES